MKKPERSSSLTIKPSVAHGANARPMARLMLALTILGLSTLTMSTMAQPARRLTPLQPQGTLTSVYVDLVPMPKPGATDTSPLNFCYGDTPGRLTVTVRNSGNTTAAASQVKVSFVVGQTTKVVTQPVPTIGAGATKALTFDYPVGCSSPDCNFSITVDSGNQVQERSETNNTANGRCLG